ncbi:MAG TPA: heme ABC exporter ATP-binding protein CcmA [Bauldia sp.]|nr:heme ABC exporter ATP-binding protein CcmA [Bauldia sp.]
MRLLATDLAAIRGGRRVFAGLAFTVGPGELLAVTGPNGAGKSTLLRVIAGLLPPSGGSVGLDPAPKDGLAGQVHYLGHLDALKPAQTVGENLEFWRRLWSGGSVLSALEAVGLGHLRHLSAGMLSAGQRRRVAIARLLLSPRPVWLLDEPTAALDAAGEEMLGGLIARYLSSGGMVVAATHRPLPVAAAATLDLGRAA